MNTTEEGKTAAITSYILIIGVFIAMSMNAENKNSFASFHIRQALGLSLTFISLGLIISNFDSLLISMLMWISISVLWTYGIFTAIKGETKPIPLLGNYFQNGLETLANHMKLSLDYLVREPKIVLEKNPLLLLLHGYGSNEEDLFSFASELPDEYYIISARAPYDLQYGSHAWYAINFDADQNKFSDNEQAVESRDLIVQFIDELIKNYPVDTNKIILLGFSQGTILSYAVALSHPDKIQKVIALSGYVSEPILEEDYLKNDLSKLKIFASHGTLDQVIPLEWARKSKPFLEKLGIDLTYKEYPIGHGVSPQVFNDFKNWLLDK